jgi:hypothetical protein
LKVLSEEELYDQEEEKALIKLNNVHEIVEEPA